MDFDLLSRKLEGLRQRSEELGDCIPFMEWFDEDGNSDAYLFLGEFLDAMLTLTLWIECHPSNDWRETQSPLR